ncbi:putative GTP pyrophosphokinase [Pseudomonas donghuensis]|uniref:GTP pyrophosphokinase n=1 Tax=Pseudomonas donghuensis TaxID=1163398 RepID=UPI0039DFB864
MTKEEYQLRFNEERPILEAWGRFIISKLNSLLSEKFGEREVERWIKIDPQLRIKKIDSLLAKAFILNKGWFENIYDDITDKVGVRYVVGLTDQISKISDVVLNSEHWHTETSKEFNSWKAEDPRIFDYQSAHHILYTIEEVEFDGILIPANTACEIQIRTLLQHAYAELSHDTLYKSTTTKQPEVHRLFAKSMALMETTDDMLSKAKLSSDLALSVVNDWRQLAIDVAEKQFPAILFNTAERENDYIIDKLSPLLNNNMKSAFSQFHETNKIVVENGIGFHQKKHEIFNLVSILITYYLAKSKRHALPSIWPLGSDILDKIYSDLGIAPPRSLD